MRRVGRASEFSENLEMVLWGHEELEKRIDEQTGLHITISPNPLDKSIWRER
jgi:hypothetical protein